MSGLSIDAIRAWERRYGIVKPERDSSGIRTYTDADVARLTLARAATKLGHPIRRVAQMSDADLATLVSQEPPAPQVRSKVDFIGRIMEALHAHDAVQAEQLLVYAGLVVPRRELALNVLAPLLRQVGDEWEHGRLGVWQEHLLSALVLKTLGASPRATQGGATMLFATPPFEQHEFGILLAEILAVSHGSTTYNLGTGVPLEELLEAAARLKPAIVVVGMTLCDGACEHAAAFAAGLDNGLPSATHIYLGGSRGVDTAAAINSKRIAGVSSLEEFNRICSLAMAA